MEDYHKGYSVGYRGAGGQREFLSVSSYGTTRGDNIGTPHNVPKLEIRKFFFSH